MSDPERQAEQTHRVLRARGESVGCAESLTGGELATTLSAPAGASATFRGGVIAYATDVKRHVLGVTAPQVVSAECAEQMAAGARRLLGCDWALATTGVAGPDRQEDQPVGTVFVAVAGPVPGSGVVVREHRFGGDRAAIRRQSVAAALALLEEVLGG